MLSELEFCCRRTAHPSGVGNGFSADDNRTYTSLAFNIVTSLSLDAFTAPLLGRVSRRCVRAAPVFAAGRDRVGATLAEVLAGFRD